MLAYQGYLLMAETLGLARVLVRVLHVLLRCFSRPIALEAHLPCSLWEGVTLGT